ncbi:MAG TPA: hypothetical protein VI566_11215 [Xanthomonadales bacterium]|nr:hypothetical protein [Xanthomonadales bacterium]
MNTPAWTLFANLIVGLVALLHLYFLVLDLRRATFKPGKSSQPQMDADKRGQSLRCLYPPARQKGEWLQCIYGLIQSQRETPGSALIVSHIFSWTRDEVFANLFSCWLQAVIFPKRYLREFVCG